MSEAAWLGLIGLMSGALLGLASRFGRFCSLGAIEDIVYGGRFYRSLMWLSAIGFSLIFTGLMLELRAFDLEQAIYLRFAPNYFAHIIGGLTFGFGMAMAGMCGFTALARLGGGDMRALVVVIIIGISAYIASSGLLAPLRVMFFSYTAKMPNQATSFADLVAHPSWLFFTLGVLLVLLPLIRANYRKTRYTFWGFIVAMGISGGWAGTYYIAQNSFAAHMVTSHTFSLPVGDSMLYLMQSTARPMSFAVGSVAGVIFGSMIGALIKGEIHWEGCDDPRELRRHIMGAFLMGVGAVIAFGCSVGQGLSAMAVLSFGAPVTLFSIVIGAVIGLKLLVEG